MKINVVKNVLDASDTLANVNRKRMDDAGITCINILSAPGSGKTTLLQRSLPMLDARSPSSWAICRPPVTQNDSKTAPRRSCRSTPAAAVTSRRARFPTG